MNIRPFVLFIAVLPGFAVAIDFQVNLTIEGQRLFPSKVKVPAGQKVTLVVCNQDATLEDFQSHELNRGKAIAGKSTATIYIGSITAGSYPPYS
jgi:hypothetical protein